MNNLSIENLKAAYSDGSLTPRQLVADLLQKIDAVDNPKIWIYRLSAEELEPYLANPRLCLDLCAECKRWSVNLTRAGFARDQRKLDKIR